MATPAVTIPSNFRTVKNASGSDIPKCRIVQPGAAEMGAALASAVTQVLLGVTYDVLPNGASDSIQVSGVAIVETGGVFNYGVDLTTDATGRAVAATVVAGAYRIIGRSQRASTGAGQFVPVEVIPTTTSIG